MCGIAGIIKYNTQTSPSEIKKMTDALVHRGPDGEGVWLNENQNVGLGHRRLSIMDTSLQAHQPMVSDNNNLVITFNGEIYNFVELKNDLMKLGHTFKTQNDTEVLLKLYEVEGVNCLQKLDGMFSFAIYDNIKNELFCARDRFGEKPFYYSFQKNYQFAFASEMKALWQIGISKQMNERMLYNYEFYGYKTNPEDHSETFFNEIKLLPSGHYVLIKDGNLELKNYYQIDLNKKRSDLNEKIIIEELEFLIKNSVQKRLRSQVTVGSSFSGGLDSSIIVNEIYNTGKYHSHLNVFSAIFPGTLKDESKYINLFLKDKPTIKSHLITPDESAYKDVIDKLMYFHEEPFISTSVIAQYYIYQRARKENTIVLLDGQGADEVFGGYHSYFHTYFKTLYSQNKLEYKTQLKKYLEINAGNKINTSINAGIFKQNVSKYFPGILNLKRKSTFKKSIPKNRISYFKANMNLKFEIKTDFKTLTEELHYQTFKLGLPALLRYADRNSMANSIEVRLPYLDHQIAELIFTLPDHFKIRDGYTKWLLRETYQSQLPQEICYRKDKIGLEPGFNHNFDLSHTSSLNRFVKIHT